MKRAEAIKLVEKTHALMNNWYYMVNGPLHYTGKHGSIVDSWLMTQRNDKQFKELFGKCTFADGDMISEYTRCWVTEFLGETFLLYSSERGSSYEVVNSTNLYGFGRNEVLGKLLVAFTTDLIKKMRALEMNQANITEWNSFKDR